MEVDVAAAVGARVASARAIAVGDGAATGELAGADAPPQALASAAIVRRIGRVSLPAKDDTVAEILPRARPILAR